jgi:succinate-acetate transporter protein
MTTVLLNLHNAGVYELNSMIIGMGIFVGGIAQIIAGIESIFCGLSAIYACAAQVLNEVYGKTVLPLGKV